MKLVLCLGIVTALFSTSQARCNFPGHPKHGNVVCDSLNLLEGEECRVVCYRGHNVKGATVAVCKNDEWTAKLGTCQAVMCPIPKTSRLTISDPPSCLSGPTPYSTHCRLSCPPGYPDEAGLYCNASGQWEGRDVECKDYQAPVIKCPAQFNVITVETDPGKATAKIRLPKPDYTDNSVDHGGKIDFRATLDSKRVSAREEHELSIGNHYVRYVVRDEAGNHASCLFRYRVVDKEQPKIHYCPNDIKVTTGEGENHVRVGWQNPIASDNSGQIRVYSNHPNHSVFYPGNYVVRYTFTDESGNVATCQFRVTVKLPCVDSSISFPSPSNPNGISCGDIASDLKKCNEAVIPVMPSFLWKLVCRKTCSAC